MRWSKFFLISFLVINLGSCIIISNDTTHISYIGKVTEPVQRPIEPIITTTGVPVKITVKDDCYEKVIAEMETGVPAKPAVSSTESIDNALLNSLQNHRRFIKAMIDKMKACRK